MSPPETKIRFPLFSLTSKLFCPLSLYPRPKDFLIRLAVRALKVFFLPLPPIGHNNFYLLGLISMYEYRQTLTFHEGDSPCAVAPGTEELSGGLFLLLHNER